METMKLWDLRERLDEMAFYLGGDADIVLNSVKGDDVVDVKSVSDNNTKRYVIIVGG